jgi:hypothetical protein
VKKTGRERRKEETAEARKNESKEGEEGRKEKKKEARETIKNESKQGKEGVKRKEGTKK